MNKYLEEQKLMINKLEKYLEPQRKLQAQLDKYLEPQRKLLAQMDKYLEPQRKLQAQLDKYLEPQRKLQAQMDKYLDPKLKLQEYLSKYIEPINDHLLKDFADSVCIDGDGSLLVSGNVIHIDTLNDRIDEIDMRIDSPEENLASFSLWFESLNDALKSVVIYLVLPYFLAIFANLTTPLYEDWVQHSVIKDQRLAKKEIIKEANDLYEIVELSEYRFVLASVLHVRESGSNKAEIVDELYLGKTVKLIGKSRRWSLVEYIDSDSGNTNQGWVFSRYLERFSK
ncbi:SH3 domain-containing protein [Vibrio europaeus]|uniref:SH3 domain-containing protein n=1 Tax=Vibrio europaeus TaxID=300876 RepID=UPI00233EF1AE|nr:SH3 domain-containing protein [Vibrio europaeus]MDC5868807.1 SH3 domain-containing protein [Vibrio europaeus]